MSENDTGQTSLSINTARYGSARSPTILMDMFSLVWLQDAGIVPH
jgi:hypothetical protein